MGQIVCESAGGKEERQRRLSLSLPFFGKKKSPSKASPILLLPCFSHAQSEESLKKREGNISMPAQRSSKEKCFAPPKKINETFVSPPRLWPTLTV